MLLGQPPRGYVPAGRLPPRLPPTPPTPPPILPLLIPSNPDPPTPHPRHALTRPPTHLPTHPPTSHPPNPPPGATALHGNRPGGTYVPAGRFPTGAGRFHLTDRPAPRGEPPGGYVLVGRFPTGGGAVSSHGPFHRVCTYLGDRFNGYPFHGSCM